MSQPYCKGSKWCEHSRAQLTDADYAERYGAVYVPLHYAPGFAGASFYGGV